MTANHNQQLQPTVDLAQWTWAPPTNLAAIRESLGVIHDNRGQSYHTGEQFESAANCVLGAHNWSSRVVEMLRDEESDEFTALIEVEAVLWITLPDDDGFLPIKVVKQDWGTQSIRRSTKSGVAQSLGDARKGAVTDGIKRCLRQLGFGWYLWEKEDIAIRDGRARDRYDDDGASGGYAQPPAQREPARPTRVPAAAIDRSSPERLASEASFGSYLDTARAQGMPEASWMRDPIEGMTDIQLQRYGALIEAYLTRTRSVAS